MPCAYATVPQLLLTHVGREAAAAGSNLLNTHEHPRVAVPDGQSHEACGGCGAFLRRFGIKAHAVAGMCSEKRFRFSVRHRAKGTAGRAPSHTSALRI